MSLDPRPTVGVSTAHSPTWLVVVEGVAAIVIGFLFFFQPLGTALAVGLLLAVYWLVRILLTFVGMLWDRDRWGWKLFLGILGFVATLALLVSPMMGAMDTAQVFLIVVGVYGVMVGTLESYLGMESVDGAQVALGAVSFLLGFMLLLHPVIAVTTLAWASGLFAVVGGAVTLWAAYSGGDEPSPEAMKPA